MSKIKLLFCVIIFVSSVSNGMTENSDLEIVKSDKDFKWIDRINMKLYWTLRKYLQCQTRFNEAIDRLIGLESKHKYLKMRNVLENKIYRLLGKRHSIYKRKHLRIRKFKNENRLINKCLRNNFNEIYQILRRRIINQYHYELVSKRINFMRRIIRHSKIKNSRTLLKKIKNLKILLRKITKSNNTVESLRMKQFFKNGKIKNKKRLKNYLRQLISIRDILKRPKFRYNNRYQNWTAKRLNRSRFQVDRIKNTDDQQHRNFNINYREIHGKKHKKDFKKEKDLGNLFDNLKKLNKYFLSQTKRKTNKLRKITNKNRLGKNKDTKRSNQMYKMKNKIHFSSDKNKFFKVSNKKRTKLERKRFLKKQLKILQQLKQSNQIYLNQIIKKKAVKRNQLRKLLNKIMSNNKEIEKLKINLFKHKNYKIRKSLKNAKISAMQQSYKRKLLRQSRKNKNNHIVNNARKYRMKKRKLEKIKLKQNLNHKKHSEMLLEFLWNHRERLLRQNMKINHQQFIKNQRQNKICNRRNNKRARNKINYIFKRNENSKHKRKHMEQYKYKEDQHERKNRRKNNKKLDYNTKKHKKTHNKNIRKVSKNEKKSYTKLFRLKNQVQKTYIAVKNKNLIKRKSVKQKMQKKKEQIKNSNQYKRKISHRLHKNIFNKKDKRSKDSYKKLRRKNKNQIKKSQIKKQIQQQRHKQTSHKKRNNEQKHTNINRKSKSKKKHLKSIQLKKHLKFHKTQANRELKMIHKQIDKKHKNLIKNKDKHFNRKVTKVKNHKNKNKLKIKINKRKHGQNIKIVKKITMKNKSNNNKIFKTNQKVIKKFNNNKSQNQSKRLIKIIKNKKNKKIQMKNGHERNSNRNTSKRNIVKTKLKNRSQRINFKKSKIKIHNRKSRLIIRKLNRSQSQVKTKILDIRSKCESIKSELKNLKTQKKTLIKNHQNYRYRLQKNKFIIDLHKAYLKMSSTTRKFFEIKLKTIKEQLKSHNKSTNQLRNEIISVDKNVNKLQNYVTSLNTLVNERLKRGVYLKKISKLLPSNPVDKLKIQRINKSLKNSKSKEKSITKQMKAISIKNIVVNQKPAQSITNQSSKKKLKINRMHTKIFNRINNKNIINKQHIKSNESRMKKESKVIENSRTPFKNKSIITSIRSNKKLVKEKINEVQVGNKSIKIRLPSININKPNNQQKKPTKSSIESKSKIRKIEEKIDRIVDVEYMTSEFIRQESSIYKKILNKH